MKKEVKKINSQPLSKIIKDLIVFVIQLGFFVGVPLVFLLAALKFLFN